MAARRRSRVAASGVLFPHSYRSSGVFVGIAGFAEPGGWPGLELAWTLARRFWGNGYATEAASAALAHAFLNWKKDRIISLIHPENGASVRVAERIGERLQGRTHPLGLELLRYGLDREAYLREVASTS